MNRLADETSPYLLQHAHNPVDWYAWKPEALERARTEQKPILVSIGYSTCHWCHVMERESFENEQIARLMNENFVCIKVDREERPDVDAIYMEACQLLTGSGGWPLNCFLTPDARPFYAGTYYPPQPAHGRPSWQQVLEYLSKIWKEEPEKVWSQAERLTGHISRADDLMLNVKADSPASDSALPNEHLHNAFYALRERFDRVEGGFGAPPKFPSSMAIDWLLQYHYHTGSQEALDHALFSLEKMCAGGIYDHLGGGFSRYSTDREWLVPHFEKMLYDNALLVSVLSDAYRILPEGDPRRADFRSAIEETLGWVKREMTHENGGFYAAQDADSEGVEGKFFVWERSEVEQVLGEEARLFCAFYDVTNAGNWEEHNILRRVSSFENFAAEWDLDTRQLCARLALSRDKLFAVRSKRVAPGTDTKVITSWNALMASAYLAAGQALNSDTYRSAGRRNLDFLLENCLSAGKQPALHVWQTTHPAFLEDYAFLIAALADCYETFFEEKYLDAAAQLLEQTIADFYDSESGLFFFTSRHQTDVVLRKKDIYDNATPSGNSTMLLNLQRLGRIFDQKEWLSLAEKMLQSMGATAERYPQSFARWGGGLLNAAFAPAEIAVVGTDALQKAAALLSFYLPNKIFCGSQNLNSKLPLLQGKSGGGEALIYVCQNFTCRAPVNSAADALRILQTH